MAAKALSLSSPFPFLPRLDDVCDESLPPIAAKALSLSSTPFPSCLFWTMSAYYIVFNEYLLLQYRNFPKARNRKSEVSLPPIAAKALSVSSPFPFLPRLDEVCLLVFDDLLCEEDEDFESNIELRSFVSV